MTFNQLPYTIANHLFGNDLISQFGFMLGCTQLLQVLDYLTQHFCVDVIYLNFQILSHIKIFAKVNCIWHSWCGSLLDWSKDFYPTENNKSH